MIMREEERARPSFEGDPPVAVTRGALRDRRELALVAIERTRMPMVVTDARTPDAPIILANQAFLDLTGYEAKEVIGSNCRFLQGPETDQRAVVAIRAHLAANEEVEIELLNYRKDGSTFWNQLAISPIHDEAGETIYHFASQKDVSARRRAEEREHAERLLLMEVDHRAMNALALVQSFVRLGRADDVQAYATAVQLRVVALARAHRLLAQNGWKGAPLGELVALQTPDIVAARIAAAGPSLELAARTVQPLALALHELMTNALAHGALASAAGSVEISWAIEDSQTLLRWGEHGPVAAPANGRSSPNGLGLALVRGVVERQLGGRLQLDWRESGLDAQLSFPTKRSLRAANDGRPSAFHTPPARR